MTQNPNQPQDNSSPVKRHYLGGSRKKLPPEEKKARQKQSWQKKYGDKIVYQARTDEIGKKRIEALKKHLGFRSNDQLLEWLLERGERSLARKGDKLDL